jgi:biotin carboxyl carrier protein
VYSTFTGAVDVVDIRVKVGDTVSKGSVLAQVEAMKATHDIKSPREGTVTAIHIQIGDEIDSSRPIMTIA